jgi:hypothetical protein
LTFYDEVEPERIARFSQVAVEFGHGLGLGR